MHVLTLLPSLHRSKFPLKVLRGHHNSPPDMDPLSITTAVVASLQVACSILSCCYSLRTEMQKIPWTLIQIIDDVRDLRNLIETAESILGKNDSSDQPGISESLVDSIKPVMATCLTELQAIEQKIRPQDVETLLGSKRKTLLQAASWRLKGDEARESILGLQRCKASLNLVISSHNSYVGQIHIVHSRCHY